MVGWSCGEGGLGHWLDDQDRLVHWRVKIGSHRGEAAGPRAPGWRCGTLLKHWKLLTMVP